MRWLIPIFILVFCGFTQIYSRHDTQDKVDNEILNIYDQAQSQQFRVVMATPNLTELRDNEVVVFSTGTLVRLMFRAGQEIYSVSVSCVTVRR